MATFKENTIPGIFQNRVEKYGDRVCVSYKKGGVYVDISWNKLNEIIRNLACYLLSIGIKKGDRIGLFSENRYEWWVADMAILSVGAINVPIYSTNSSEETQYILENSGSVLCFVSTEDHLDRVLKAKKKLPLLKRIVVFNKYDKEKGNIVSLDSALEIGRAYKQKSSLDKKIKAIKPEDLATIMYTSGTTGNPKGVMLTHSNFVSQGENIEHELRGMMTENDLFLSFLPLSHVLERTCGYYSAIYIGATVAFAEDISKLLENFKEVRPTIIISVPRIYEKIHTGILSQLADAPALKKAIVKWAIATAQKNLPYACKNLPRTGLFAKRFDLADKMVFSKLKNALGLDRMRFAISGGGPLSVTDAEFFIGMGVQIMEGFGLTETSPVTNFNRPGELTPGSVGRVIPKTKLKISDEGELLVKGPQVMKGYYKNPKATKEAFTKDGYFRTGDMARIDEEGRLWITGRIKDLIVTSGGKNISPQNIENSLKASHLIEQVAIIGDNRKYLAALIVPAFEELQKWAKRNNISFSSHADLLKNDAVQQIYDEEIKKYTKNFARVEQIRKFKLLDAEWTQESGELTPSQKVKRRVINEKYANEIESMYPPEA
ncbi:MAG TPA: long-chain fatty acid--CoA ligase [Spirochaetota bacterium]|nr:long-chain fatty acid--CoA ligase [Spirochaetota bacterium]HPI88295.1 long-chain fatty acid--CoA ligase [Spirochaetota bacterium]HPR47759.1 long-chain fatty acid--CoA ligase [Spirochaetota bacterium]